MTATRPLASQPPKAVPKTSVLTSSPLKTKSALTPDGRETLLQQSSRLDAEARGAAERGDMAAAAQLILEALDCERRAGSLGPQVLQLIKPRG